MSEKSMYRRLIKPDGTKAITFNGKLHCWDGPALIPEGDESKAEYYIYGIQYTKDQWKAALRDHNGLPWYKLMSTQTRF
jgi:hypothetical protein